MTTVDRYLCTSALTIFVLQMIDHGHCILLNVLYYKYHVS